LALLLPQPSPFPLTSVIFTYNAHVLLPYNKYDNKKSRSLAKKNPP
jgi:hypothetical protein